MRAAQSRSFVSNRRVKPSLGGASESSFLEDVYACCCCFQLLVDQLRNATTKTRRHEARTKTEPNEILFRGFVASWPRMRRATDTAAERVRMLMTSRGLDRGMPGKLDEKKVC